MNAVQLPRSQLKDSMENYSQKISTFALRFFKEFVIYKCDDMEIRNKALNLVDAIVFGITIVGVNLIQFVQLDWKLLLGISLVLSIVYFYLLYKPLPVDKHAFDEHSEQFFEYFEKWYLKEGILSIYCNDLEWLESSNGYKVVHSLKSRKDSLNLYIRETESNVVKFLESHGAKVIKVKDTVKTTNRFSIVGNADHKHIIIRNKKVDESDSKIVFIETTDKCDPYLISLAEDFLEFCKAP